MMQSRSRRSIYLKMCPRCNGDIGVRSDQYGKYVYCLQCGYTADIVKTTPIEAVSPPGLRDNVA